MTSLAVEIAGRLSHGIDQLAATVVEPASDAGPVEDDDENDHIDGHGQGSTSATLAVTASTARLTAILHRVRTSSYAQQQQTSAVSRLFSTQIISPLDQLKQLAQETAETAARLDSSPAISSQDQRRLYHLQWLIGAQLAVGVYCNTLSTLFQQAQDVKAEESYWESVDGRDHTTLLYLVQTTPVRVINVFHKLLRRLDVIAPRRSVSSSSSRPPRRPFSYTRARKALTPSLLITSLFPHLASQQYGAAPSISAQSNEGESGNEGSGNVHSLLFLTFSPLLLTRQEISLKRKHLKKIRYSLARQIGALVKDAEAACDAIPGKIKDSKGKIDLSALGDILGGRLAFMRNTLPFCVSSTTVTITSPSTMLDAVKSTISDTQSTPASSVDQQITKLSKPSWLTRNWPVLLTAPIISYYAYSKIYNARESLYNLGILAWDTIRGFVVDWVVDPCFKIFATLRHSDSLALMGKDSLKSDFDSLERMVADFARDQKLTPDEINRIVSRVREGDMTLVLETYENDLKSPLKSAVAGNLVRTLLIQIQKVKVDVDLAMNGIEQMLKSQQLTFAFVGVAPSMVLLYGVIRYLRRIGSGSSSGVQEERKRVWYTMRAVDRLLTDSMDALASPAEDTLNDEANGLLLVELTTLRQFAQSSSFPTRDRTVKAALLEDIRDLEKYSTGVRAKIRVFDRVARSYSQYL